MAIVFDKASIDMKTKRLIQNGRVMVTSKKELEQFPIGSLISHQYNQNLFIKGGFIIKFGDDYFNYITLDFNKKYKVRYCNLEKMWVSSVFECRNDYVSIIKSDKFPTKYSVTICDIPIYFGNTSYDIKRFKSTDRYRLLLQWCDYFLPDDKK